MGFLPLNRRAHSPRFLVQNEMRQWHCLGEGGDSTQWSINPGTLKPLGLGLALGHHRAAFTVRNQIWLSSSDCIVSEHSNYIACVSIGEIDWYCHITETSSQCSYECGCVWHLDFFLNDLLVPAAHGMVRQRPDRLPHLLSCYCVRVSAPTRVATPHLGSGYASSESIPWSIDRISWQDFIPNAWFCCLCEIIWHD